MGSLSKSGGLSKFPLPRDWWTGRSPYSPGHVREAVSNEPGVLTPTDNKSSVSTRFQG